MTESNVPVKGIAWYESDQWDRLRDISDDSSELEETYEEWKKNTEKKIKELKKQGYQVKKVPVDTEDLLSWCNSYRMSVKGSSRNDYTTKRLREISRGSS